MENLEILKKLGFNINSKGFNYWLLAINLYKRNVGTYNIGNITNIYKEISEIYHTKAQSVERCMRTARIPANENIQQEFNYNSKITNFVCLKLLAMNM